MPIFCKEFPCFGMQLPQRRKLFSKSYHILTNFNQRTPNKLFDYLLSLLLNLSNDTFFKLYLCMTSDLRLCLVIFLNNKYTWITIKYSYELTPAMIHKVRLKINHTQYLRSMSWQPEDANWVINYLTIFFLFS